jgi:hypothetical protein
MTMMVIQFVNWLERQGLTESDQSLYHYASEQSLSTKDWFALQNWIDK